VRFHADPTLPVRVQVVDCGPKLVANQKHLDLLRLGVGDWNARKIREPITPDLRDALLTLADLSGANLQNVDLRGATLSGAKFSGANLSGTDLRNANLSGADLRNAFMFTYAHLQGSNLSEVNLSGAELAKANLSKADLREANLSESNLGRADLSGADLRGADLRIASFISANLGGADLSGADISGAQLIETNLVAAILTGCGVYGVSAWNVKITEDTQQRDLVIAPPGEPEVTTDDLEVAQFIYLMLHNEKLQRVIDTITSKVILILGRFSIPERKAVLNALRDELRKYDYVPVVFDFEKPRNLTTVNTIVLLARMARFVVADLSDAKSVLQELDAIVPSSPKLPVQPIIVAGQEWPGMFDSIEAYQSVLKVHRYDSLAQLLADLKDRVIGPLEAAVAKLR
jgi:Pentapeptide repeats (8 copies)